MKYRALKARTAERQQSVQH